MRFLLTLSILLTVTVLFAQEVSLKSPRETLNLFTRNTQQQQYTPEKAIAIFNAPESSAQEKKEWVVKLDRVLTGAGIVVLNYDIPSSRNFFDTLTMDSVYVIDPQYPEIRLKRMKGRWQFQPTAVRAINKAYSDMFSFGINLLEEQQVRRSFLGISVFGLQVWQWLGILCFITVGVIARLLISLFFKRLLMRLISELGKAELGHRYLLPVSRPVGMLVVLASVAVFYPVLQLPGLLGHYLVLALKGFIPLFGTIVTYRLVDILGVIMTKVALSTTSTLDDQLVPLLKKVLKVVVVISGGLVILDSLDVPILPLLTGLSIGGLAFALAAQDTIKNFFGSLMIFIDKPFQIGDWINSGEIDGTVEEVGFRSTRIRTFRNSVIYVPNGKLADAVIDNNGLRQFRRFRTIIALKYDTPPDRIEVFVEGLKKLVLRHPKTNKEKFEIHLNDMGDSSLNILFYIFFEAATWTEELTFRQELILDILRLGEALSVHFAFPTQTVHVENLPGQESLSPRYTWTKDDLRQKLSTFLEKDFS